MNYFCCLNFRENDAKIFLYHNSLEKAIITTRKIKMNNITKKNLIMSIGCDSLSYDKDPKEKDEKKNFFSGFIGPIIIVKILQENLININEEKIIEEILLLKEGYKDLLFYHKKKKFKKKGNIINFNQDLMDYSLKRNDNINVYNINTLVKPYSTYFECLLYLVPNCFIYFHNKNDIKKNYHLPLVSDFCNYHKEYKIKKINITLFKCNSSITNFIYDNGFNYFCLQFEYFNQMVQYYLTNKEINKDNFNNIFSNETDLMKDIINCIKINLLMLISRGNEINLSKVYKQTFMVLYNLLKNLNKIRSIIKDIIGDIMSFSDVYKCYILSNYYQLGDILYKQQIIKNEMNNEADKSQIGKNLLSEEKIKELTDYYNDIIKKNCSFFVGIMEILLSKEFYSNNIKESEKYLFMISAFEKISSIMDINENACLSFLSYKSLFNQTLSFTSLLENIMHEYLPEIKVLNNNNNNNFYYIMVGKKNIKENAINLLF